MEANALVIISSSGVRLRDEISIDDGDDIAREVGVLPDAGDTA